MAIPLTTSGISVGLFNRLGKIGLLIADSNTYEGTTLVNDITSILNLYEGAAANLSNAEPDIVGNLPNDQTSNQSGVAGITGNLNQYASNTVIRMVYRDNPQPDAQLSTALKELIRQMKVAAATVKACTITVTVNTAPGVTNNGTGVCVASTKRGDGLVQEDSFAETENVVCIQDNQSGGAQAGNETFQFRGQAPQNNPFLSTWPLGSGANVNFAAINATQDNSQGNLLKNSGFEIFTVANVPDNWVLAVGAAGTDFLKGATVYTGSASAQFAGGATNTSITQQFNVSSAGTPGKLLPDTQYAVNFWAKVDVVPAAGVLTVDLIDGNNAVINDDQGVANSFTVSCPSLTTSFTAQGKSNVTVFRTPKALPAVQKIRLRLSTALSGGSNLFVDQLAFGPMTQLYNGGPSLAIFSGATAFLLNDAFQIVTTNDRGGAANLKNMQTLFDRCFAMRDKGLLLPSSGAPSISDSLIG